MRTWKILVLVSAVIATACLKPLQQEVSDSPRAGAISGSSDETIAPEPVGGLALLQSAVNQPEEVRKQNRTGTAVVAATVSSNGRVVETRIVKSSGSAAMDAEAMLAVARASWKPGRRNGVPVTATVEVTLNFGPGY